MAIVQNNVTFNGDLSDFDYTGLKGKYTDKGNLIKGEYDTSLTGKE